MAGWRDKWDRLPWWGKLLLGVGLPAAGVAVVVAIEKHKASPAADSDTSGGSTVPMLDNSNGADVTDASATSTADDSTINVVLQQVTPDRGQWLVPAVSAAALKYDIDPLMFMAFPAWESDYGSKLTLPFQALGEGDSGHAVGPFQLDKRFHAKFLNSPDAGDVSKQAMYVAANVIVPAVKAFPGNTDAQIAAYNAGVAGVKKALAAGENPGQVTTPTPHGSYVDAVNFEWEQLKSASDQEVA